MSTSASVTGAGDQPGSSAADGRAGGPFELTMVVMHRLLRGELSSAEAARQLAVREERLNGYQRFVRGHVAYLLEQNYDVLAHALPRESWSALVDRYFQQSPPRHYELNANAAGFVDLVAERAAAGAPGITAFHADLAALLWQESASYFSETELPTPSPGQPPVLNPTLTVLWSRYPVTDYLDRARALLRQDNGAPMPAAPEPAAERVLVFREPRGLTAVHYRATDDLTFALKMAHEQVSVAHAATIAGLPEATVRQIWRRAGEIGLVLAHEHA